MEDVVSDMALAMGALVKPVTLTGYEIAKPIRKRNDAIRSNIAKALDFDGGRALRRGRPRSDNAASETHGSESSSHMQDACSSELPAR